LERLLARGIWLAALCGLGLGLIASGVIISFFPTSVELSNAQVMERARTLGMQDLSTLPPGARRSVYLWVTSELNFNQVGQMLHQAGVITEVDSFRLRAEELGFVRLQAGSHLVKEDDSLDQILAKVGRKD